MSVLTAIVYGAFALGYLAIIGLTERSAGRYVRGELAPARTRTAIAITAPDARAASGPSHARTSFPLPSRG
jgi:hypothetical protein